MADTKEKVKKVTASKVLVPPKTTKKISALKQLLRSSDVLLMLYPKGRDGLFTESINSDDEVTIYKLIKSKTRFKKKLLIFMDTSGGNVYSAVKIMDILRTKYSNIKIAVAQKAKSSGSLMCCAADALVMSPISELGPLDKPMIHPDNETARISALDIVRSIDGTLDNAHKREKAYAEELRDEYGIPLKQSFSLASESISRLVSPMLGREDVKIYNQALRLLQIAETYAKELLPKYMLKYIKNQKLRTKIAEAITRQLVWLYPDHGFAIRRNELDSWFFIIINSETQDYWEELWTIFESHIDPKGVKLIKFI